MAIGFIENAEKGTTGDLICWKGQKNKFREGGGGGGGYFMEKGKIRYDWGFILLKMLK